MKLSLLAVSLSLLRPAHENYKSSSVEGLLASIGHCYTCHCYSSQPTFQAPVCDGLYFRHWKVQTRRLYLGEWKKMKGSKWHKCPPSSSPSRREGDSYCLGCLLLAGGGGGGKMQLLADSALLVATQSNSCLGKPEEEARSQVTRKQNEQLL